MKIKIRKMKMAGMEDGERRERIEKRVATARGWRDRWIKRVEKLVDEAEPNYSRSDVAWNEMEMARKQDGNGEGWRGMERKRERERESSFVNWRR